MYKKNISFMIILLYMFTITSIDAIELDWEHNYDIALSQAKDQNKTLYLFIGADVCRFCKKFKKITLSKSEVIDRMKKDFILLYMSRDQQKIPDRFEKYGVPKHYFISPEGEIILSEQGVWDKESWFTLLDEALED